MTEKQEISNISIPNRNTSLSDSDDAFNPTRSETALWKAVITQALMDAGSNSPKSEAIQEKRRAIQWLLGNSEDFSTVCLNAGLEPSYVRQKARSAIQRGCVWRSESLTANPTLQNKISSLALHTKSTLMHFPPKMGRTPVPIVPSRREIAASTNQALTLN